jgi:hypothetical protein
MIAQERLDSVASRMRTDFSISRSIRLPAFRAGLRISRLPAFCTRNLCVSAAILLPLASLSQTKTGCDGASDLRRSCYVGDQVCASCHKEQSLPYLHTAHHLTSSLPSKDSIPGSFEEPTNTLKIQDPAPAIGDPGLTYKMSAKDSKFFVTAITGFPGQLQSRTESMDIVIGSGIRGQSYLYWAREALYELPVSYWSDGRRWINSPGYRNGPPNFQRAAIPRCLECHVSYLKPLTPDPAANRYDAATLAPGISCETCHGPGAAHATLKHAGQSTSKTTSTILNPAGFTRERQIDLCALCHSGAQQTALAPAFSYVPGTPLESYLHPVDVAVDVRPDVHANQVGLLKKSRCFIASDAMTCSTCHEVHAPERPTASYSAKCLGCHKVESCKTATKLGQTEENNCIDCHMPLQQTQAIVSQTGDRVIRTTMRTHWIQVYPDEAR